MKKLITISLMLFLGFFLAPKVHAGVYPIADLGNCRDTKECTYYCNIPANAPACWSYMTYVQKKAVLGETSSKSALLKKELFPIAELGNCASTSACKQYCDLTEHQTACRNFAKKKGLLKPTPTTSNDKFLEEAKKLLGCTSFQTCKALCYKPENQQKCRTMLKQMNQPKPSQSQTPQRTQMMQKPSSLQIKCTNNRECYEYCLKHTKECPGFRQNKQPSPSGMPMQKRNDMPKGTGMPPREGINQQFPPQTSGIPPAPPEQQPQDFQEQ